MSKLSNFLLATFLAILCFGFYFDQVAFAENSILTQEQSSWLSKRNNTILIRPERNYPPFVFSVQNGFSNVIQGLGVDYLELITKKIGAKVQYFEPTQLSNILSSFKEGKEGVAIALTKTAEREEYLYFTKPFISIPAVIVARKDSNLSQGNTSLADLSGKVVAVGKDYAVESYIKSSYPNIVLDSLPDDEVALQKLLLGEVDAAVMDLASLSYYTSKDVLSYVKAIGRTGFEYKHSFAVPKSKPELLLILDQGLKSLSDAEKQVIIDKWIDIGSVDNAVKLTENSTDNNLHLWLIFAGFVVLIVATVVTVITLRKTQIKMLFSRTRKKEAVSEVEDELKELQRVHQSLKEEMEHVSALEEDIEKKIHNVE